jgi:hypothetical protein
VQELFDEVRAACSGSAWSRGVELVRAGAVAAPEETGGEVHVRISTRGGLVCPTVILNPALGGWECDCGSREEACEHAAAAVISLRRSASGAAPAPATEAPGRIGYRLARHGGGLALERAIVTSRGEHPLTSTLAAVAEGRVAGPPFAATQADLAVERTLGTRLRGALPRGLLLALLRHLATCSDVQLDGRPVRVTTEPVGLAGARRGRRPGLPAPARVRRLVEETFDEPWRSRAARCCSPPRGSPAASSSSSRAGAASPPARWPSS